MVVLHVVVTTEAVQNLRQGLSSTLEHQIHKDIMATGPTGQGLQTWTVGVHHFPMPGQPSFQGSTPILF